jgi:hypothetical protein
MHQGCFPASSGWHSHCSACGSSHICKYPWVMKFTHVFAHQSYRLPLSKNKGRKVGPRVPGSSPSFSVPPKVSEQSRTNKNHLVVFWFISLAPLRSMTNHLFCRKCHGPFYDMQWLFWLILQCLWQNRYSLSFSVSLYHLGNFMYEVCLYLGAFTGAIIRFWTLQNFICAIQIYYWVLLTAKMAHPPDQDNHWIIVI